MRKLTFILGSVVTLSAMVPTVRAQDNTPRPNGGATAASDYTNSSVVTKMMAFAKHDDGKLYRDEVTDTRLHALFDDADTNHSGVVTKDQLIALAAKLDAQTSAGGNFGGGPGGPDGGPGGPGGPGGRGGRNGRGFGGAGGGPGGFGGGQGGFGGGPGGPGGPGGGGGFGGPNGRGPGGPRIIPPGLEPMLNLTPEQQNQVEELQRHVNAMLATILTPGQNRQLQQFRGRGGRGPGGFGGPGGPDGFGGGPGRGPDGPGGPGGPDGGPGGPPPRPQ